MASDRRRAGRIVFAQGLRVDHHPEVGDQARKLLTGLEVVDIGGQDIAIQAARNYRALRERGITIRKTIDTLIATRCIESDYALLYSDRDFDPFVEHLGLSSAMS
jgi:predicted nucleic acid-binding protein